jgi:hypothetical protein
MEMKINTYFNGGIFYKIKVFKNSAKIYDSNENYITKIKIQKKYIPKDDINITGILFFTGLEEKNGISRYSYIYINNNIIKFFTDEEILFINMNIQNNEVPYTYAISENYVYFLADEIEDNNGICINLNNIKINNINDDSEVVIDFNTSDPYDYLYKSNECQKYFEEFECIFL